MKRPAEVKRDQDTYSDNEVGIIHQVNGSFIRLADSGDIEISPKKGLAMIMHPQNNSITFVADEVKFYTKDDNGLRWNKLSFNPQATRYTEPALVPYDNNNEMKSLYRGIDEYLEDE